MNNLCYKLLPGKTFSIAHPSFSPLKVVAGVGTTSVIGVGEPLIWQSVLAAVLISETRRVFGYSEQRFLKLSFSYQIPGLKATLVRAECKEPFFRGIHTVQERDISGIPFLNNARETSDNCDGTTFLQCLEVVKSNLAAGEIKDFLEDTKSRMTRGIDLSAASVQEILVLPFCMTKKTNERFNETFAKILRICGVGEEGSVGGDSGAFPSYPEKKVNWDGYWGFWRGIYESFSAEENTTGTDDYSLGSHLAFVNSIV